jgi:hypothetical protein
MNDWKEFYQKEKVRSKGLEELYDLKISEIISLRTAISERLKEKRLQYESKRKEKAQFKREIQEKIEEAFGKIESLHELLRELTLLSGEI